ncbi:hypothetical protein Vafri_2566, partial [Volvox africanus]
RRPQPGKQACPALDAEDGDIDIVGVTGDQVRGPKRRRVQELVSEPDQEEVVAPLPGPCEDAGARRSGGPASYDHQQVRNQSTQPPGVCTEPATASWYAHFETSAGAAGAPASSTGHLMQYGPPPPSSRAAHTPQSSGHQQSLLQPPHQRLHTATGQLGYSPGPPHGPRGGASATFSPYMSYSGYGGTRYPRVQTVTAAAISGDVAAA